MNDVIVDYIPTLFGHLQKIPLELARAIVRLPAAEPHVVTMKLEVDKESLKKAMEEMELTLVPAEPRKGRWIEEEDADWAGGGYWRCSACGYGYSFGMLSIHELNYCPNCGARMTEESE